VVEKADYVYIWDPLVRCFHWSAGVLILSAYWWLEGGGKPHEWAGYALGALVAVRVVWGFVGSVHARFVDFLPSPSRIRRHLSEPTLDPRRGHNPLGGLMILAMLVLMLLIVVSGWMQTTDRFWGEPRVERLHEYSADMLMCLAVVHVSAVLWIQRFSGVPLVRPMLSGWRKAPYEADNFEER